jgi:polyene glycosyltransferase
MSTEVPGPIVFAGAPYSGMTPMIVTAAEVARRGADVYFVGTESYRPEFDERTAGTGARYLSLGAGDSPADPATWDDETFRSFTQPSRWRSAKAFVKHNLDIDIQIDWYKRLEAEVERLRPALLVVDCLSQYAIDLAMTRNIRFVIEACLMPSFVLQPWLPADYPWPYSGLPRQMTRAQRLANAWFRFRMRTVMFRPGVFGKAVSYARQARAMGINAKAMHPRARIEAASLVMFHTPLDLEYPFPVPENVVSVGSITPPLPEMPAEQGLSSWLDAQESVVYLAFGTINRLSPASIGAMLTAAARLSPHAVLWKIPKDQWETRPADVEVPDNVRVEHWVPSQFDVLAHPNVKVFFTHAGSNGMHECLNFGKPMVSRPGWIDCHDIAHRISDAGMGLTLDDVDVVRVDDVVDKVSRVLDDPGFTERARFWTERQRELGGVSRAAELIIAHAW